MRSATKNLVYRPRRPWDSNLNYQGSARGALPLEPLALICRLFASDFRVEWGEDSPVCPDPSGDTHCWEECGPAHFWLPTLSGERHTLYWSKISFLTCQRLWTNSAISRTLFFSCVLETHGNLSCNTSTNLPIPWEHDVTILAYITA